MRWWKAVGLAGLAGVAATGVAVARAERQRRAYTPEDVRARLHARLEQVAADRVAVLASPAPPAGPAAGTGTGSDEERLARGARSRLGRLVTRLRRRVERGRRRPGGAGSGA